MIKRRCLSLQASGVYEERFLALKMIALPACCIFRSLRPISRLNLWSSSSNLAAVSLQYRPRLVNVLANLLQEGIHRIELQFLSKPLHVFQLYFLVV